MLKSLRSLQGSFKSKVGEGLRSFSRNLSPNNDLSDIGAKLKKRREEGYGKMGFGRKGVHQ